MRPEGCAVLPKSTISRSGSSRCGVSRSTRWMIGFADAADRRKRARETRSEWCAQAIASAGPVAQSHLESTSEILPRLTDSLRQPAQALYFRVIAGVRCAPEAKCLHEPVWFGLVQASESTWAVIKVTYVLNRFSFSKIFPIARKETMRWTVGTQVPKVALLAADAHGHSLHTPGEKASNHYERSLPHRGCDRILQVSAVLRE
jgi:hypothetical protein